MQDHPLIGIFDSGLGGLNALLWGTRLMPEASFLYYGDNARAPYGTRNSADIARFTFEAFSLFQREGTDAALIACNTATAVCAESLRKKFPFPIVGMEPAVKSAAKISSRVLVLCTKATKESARLKTLLAKFPSVSFEVFAPEGLVEEIEGKLAMGESIDFSKYLKKATRDPKVGAVVLGCTHFEFFEQKIGEFFRAPTFSGSEGAVKRLKTFSVLSSKMERAGTAVHAQPRENPPVRFLGSGSETNKKVYEMLRKL